MSFKDLFPRIIPPLEDARVPYMLTGSVASSLHGNPRSTRDLDVVIDPTRDQLQVLILKLSVLDFYADELQAMVAFKNRNQFNVMDNVTGWKVDFIFKERSPYGQTAFTRQQDANIAGHKVRTASAEDVLLAKMRWAKASGSDLQIRDASGILRVQRKALDFQYIEQWIRELQLEDQWSEVQKVGAP